MIYFVCTRKHDYTIRQFRDGPGSAIHDRIGVLHYSALLREKTAPYGTYIVSDYERLAKPIQRPVERMFDRIAAAGAPVLNHPVHSMRRPALLERLADEGINDFRAYRLRDRPKPKRFPVFIRWANDHDVVDPDLIPDQVQLDAAIGRELAAARETPQPDEKLVVEFIDTRCADGLHRKYATFRIGERFIPRQIHSSENWVVKRPDVDSAELAEEERRFLESDETVPLLHRVFDIASIAYGRIDFCFVDGRIQIFEINSNPTILGPKSLAMAHRGENYRRVGERLCDAFAAIDSFDGGGRIALDD
jgi:hypothetical protein